MVVYLARRRGGRRSRASPSASRRKNSAGPAVCRIELARSIREPLNGALRKFHGRHATGEDGPLRRRQKRRLSDAFWPKKKSRENLPLVVPHFFVYGRGAAVGRGGLKIRLSPDTFTAATAHGAHPAPRAARLASRTQLHKNTPNSLYIRVHGYCMFFLAFKTGKSGENKNNSANEGASVQPRTLYYRHESLIWQRGARSLPPVWPLKRMRETAGRGIRSRFRLASRAFRMQKQCIAVLIQL